ncbi:MAG: methyl-accepting chemotaxis protein [Clostridia bacterium]
MILIRNSTIKVKIFLLIVIAALFMTAVGVVGYTRMTSMAENSKEMYNQHLVPIGWIEQIRINNEKIQSLLLEMILSQDSRNREKIQTLSQQNDLKMAMYEKKQMDDKELNIWKSYKFALQDYQESQAKVLALAIEKKSQEAYSLYIVKVQENSSLVNGLLNSLTNYARAASKELDEQTTAEMNAATQWMIVTTVSAVLACGLIGLFIARIITNPLRNLQKLMANAERGDLTVSGTYRSKDEIGQLTKDFNSMMTGLRELIYGVSENAVSLSSSAEQLSASTEQTAQATNHIAVSIQEVSQGSDTQLRAVEEGMQAMEEITTGIERAAQTTSVAAHSTVEANAEASHGNQAIQRAIEQMQLIQSSVHHSADVTKRLGERSQEIGQIVEAISDISAQTNLLALNAAIEAARAGEHGRGFSVVADEVRKLAEQSQVSADRITELIEVIRQETTLAVSAMDKGYDDVEEGMAVVREAGDAFQKISEKVSQVAVQMEDVSVSSEQMLTNTRNFAQSVGHIEKIARESLRNAHAVAASSQEQLASMEEISASTEALNKMAQELHELTGRFKV